MAGYTCVYSNDWYSQCVVATTTAATTKTTTTTKTTSTTTVATTAAATSTATRTSTPSGCLTVRKSGTLSGEYSTIGAALTALGSTTTAKCIFIYGGTYSEKLTINYKGALTIYGYTTDTGSYKSNSVIITQSMTSTQAGTLDLSSTANIVSANFKAYNVNFVNSYGSGSQAVAVTANGDKQGYYGCSFKGYQDTLYAKSGLQYYSNCYIEGAVDYIFGKAAAWFGECTIASSGAGYITANSRETSSDTSWYVFDHSTVREPSHIGVTMPSYPSRLRLHQVQASLAKSILVAHGAYLHVSFIRTRSLQTLLMRLDGPLWPMVQLPSFKNTITAAQVRIRAAVTRISPQPPVPQARIHSGGVVGRAGLIHHTKL